VADQPACLCIVSRDRLRGGDFIAALEASLGPQDHLEIIIDRRSGEPSGEWDRAADRRRRPQVDLALKANGFAMIPAPRSSHERAPLSMLLPSASSPRHADEDDDEERLEAIRSFKRGRSSSLVPWLIAVLAVAGAAAFVLSPVGHTLKESLADRMHPESPARATRPEAVSSTQPAPPVPEPTTAPPQGPAVADRPGAAEVPARSGQTTTADGSNRQNGVPPSATEPRPSPTRDATGAVSPRDAQTPSPGSGAGARAASGQVTRERPRSTDGIRPGASASAPKPMASVPSEPSARASSPRFAGLPRVELSQEPGVSGTYAVRVVDPAGRVLSDAEVLLLAHMPDGTVENVRMHYSRDHGAYRCTLPPTGSSPVDLRVRVITGDKRVEVPLGP
jgi:hypothetical protein